jgi:hypothetical protein
MNLRAAALLILLPALVPPALSACTLWAAVGPQAGQGTLLSKNRDWRPDHRQVLAVVRPAAGFAYLGLYAEGNADPGLKSGVNERGLSVVVASSNIPRAARAHQPGKHGILARILSGYGDVDALAADAGKVFGQARANFYLVADRQRVLVAEVGLDGAYHLEVVAAGTTAHTNHYLDPGLAERFNARIGASSAARLARIRELLAGGGPFSLERFAAISRDRHDGPDDSLWRDGREHTLSSWIVAAPPAGAPRLRVLLANPGKPEVLREFILDEGFWKRTPAGTV